MIMRSNGKLFSIVMIALLLVGCTAPAAVSPTATFTPTSTTVSSPMPTEDPIPAGHLVYVSQSGDTLAAVASHFGVKEDQIIFAEGDELSGLLSPETLLYIPDVLEDTTPDVLLIPDSDLVYSPSTIGFDVSAFVEQQGGRLAEYTELMTRGTTPGAEILTQLAVEFSVNPRILLTLMEYASGWVSGQPQTDAQGRYPYGFIQTDKGGLYKQLGLAVREVERGYYGWRAGTLTEVTFSDGSSMRLAPNLNAGTVAVLTYLAAISTPQDWENGILGEGSIPAMHTDLFGDACSAPGKWSRSLRRVLLNLNCTCPSQLVNSGITPAPRILPGARTHPKQRLILRLPWIARAAAHPSNLPQRRLPGWWCAPVREWQCLTWTGMAMNKRAGYCSTCMSPAPKKCRSVTGWGWMRI